LKIGQAARSGIRSALFCLALAGAQAVHGLRPVPGCPNPVESDFEMTTLVSRAGHNLVEPIHIALDRGPQGEVDVYFTERYGNLRKYDGATRLVSTLANLPVVTNTQNGLLGIALDPAFAANRRVYLYHSPRDKGPFHYRVSRFTLGADGLDPKSEKVVLAFPAPDSVWHTGGALRFDRRGDLWITVGEFKTGENGPANTNSLFGKILRIRPLEVGGYSIPEGNLFPAGTEKTRPEIYIMGNMNPYSIALDPLTGWMAWGEMGPDGNLAFMSEEVNIVSRPGNHGWPYFTGPNQVYKPGKIAAEPVNESPGNTGLVRLPPAVPGSFNYIQSAALTGPIFRYDPANADGEGMPPHFDGLWFVTDYNPGGRYGSRIDTMSLSGDAVPGPRGRLFEGLKLDRPIDFQAGPDGALYAINYAGFYSATEKTSIVRIAYKGACRTDAIGARNAPAGPELAISGSRIRVAHRGESRVKIHSLQGETLYSVSLRGGGEVELGGRFHGRPGLYALRLETGDGTFSRKILLGER
jgi:cytochrome c